MLKYVTNLTKLKKYGITPNQYLFLYLISGKHFSELKSYIDSCGLFLSSDIDKLIKIGLLINNNKDKEFLSSKYEVTMDCLDLLEIDSVDNFTDSLWKKFPSSTPSGRKLKQVSKKTVDTMYVKCHNNSKEEHEKILKLLDKELEDRKRRNTLDFMQALKTWLHNRSFLAYEEEESSDNQNLIVQHGSKLF